MVAETFGWEEGLDKKFYQAKPFYGIIILSMLIALATNYIGVSPVKSLFYTAVLYGLTAPIMIFIILHISNNKTVMGEYVNRPWSNILGWITFISMTAAAGCLIYFQIV
jgi:Mn2+/Fe2+ NRAMP family transporter